ncbi:MAG: Glutamate racemase [Patescibacteria group bacterium]|nr:Glutamate racemase [Patescibacteria group bacterium]MDQ5970376.1 Glutamate racemase [Patescibacteria group bacterium]
MIGVFDSGFGGLTIFKAIEKKLPQFDYIYLGDNARAPYGNHSQEVIYEYTRQAVDYLFQAGCDLIILACNTASSEALRKLQQEYVPKKYPGKNILGVIRPLAEAASLMTKNKVVAVMGTRSTVESKSYIKELQIQVRKIKVVQQACPLLVPLIEENWEKTPETKMILKKYIRPLKSHFPDTVILGCTHYGWLQKDIERYFGKNIKVLDSGKIVADKLAEYLLKHPEYAKKTKSKPKTIFLTTDDAKRFQDSAEKYLGRKIKAVRIILNN